MLGSTPTFGTSKTPAKQAFLPIQIKLCFIWSQRGRADQKFIELLIDRSRLRLLEEENKAAHGGSCKHDRSARPRCSGPAAFFPSFRKEKMLLISLRKKLTYRKLN